MRYIMIFIAIIASSLVAFSLFGPKFPPIGPLTPVPIPADNPQTQAKIDFGKQLYFDPRLSGNNKISCATCHLPSLGFSNGQPFAKGGPDLTDEGGRNTPTVYNTAYNKFQFWDGRAATLEEQALGPVQNPVEMHEDLNKLVAELSAIPEYVRQSKEIFGTEITSEVIAKAIAAFERTIISTNCSFDKYMKGDKTAMSESAIRGMKLFNKKARCIVCHNGPNFTDDKFHNLGLPSLDPNKPPDVGRYAVTKNEADMGAFKTPTLRSVVETAPYLRNGFMRTLMEVIEFYDQGGGRDPNKDKEMKRLNLTQQEKQDLEEFMKALTGEPLNITPPALP
ncbi:MAG TPA: cytochrome-c peroxidase [Candidatus Brocadiia bacterium]|nr:cytochrome-c peroxidase [Planctomycetota bacterium]MDO8093522.1 cytochrome c peroxidase [Candidatus Brocadiales bacterium]